MSTGAPSTASKSTGSRQPGKDADDARRAHELAVRDGDPLPKPGGAEPLTLQERVEDIALLKPGELGRARGQFLQELLLVLDLERGDHRLGADQIS